MSQAALDEFKEAQAERETKYLRRVEQFIDAHPDLSDLEVARKLLLSLWDVTPESEEDKLLLDNARMVQLYRERCKISPR